MAPIFEPLTDAHVRLGAPRADDRVLDLACGSGALSCHDRVWDVASVVGLDLNRARLRDGRAGTAAWACVAARAEALPLADAAFLWVACQHGLMFFSDVGRVLREIARVLAPGGRTTLTAWLAVERSSGFRCLNGALVREVGEDAARNAAVPFSMPDPERIAVALRDARFSEVGVDGIEVDVAYASAREFALSFIAATSLAPVVARAGREAAARVAELVEREIGGGPGPFHFIAHAYCVSGTRARERA